ncbi:MAG: hypothetical protein Q4E62_01075, partial [Sutterellaceae bacterium]|nr:hypothetical protein [Sutterellaceae bacterium]
SNFGTNQDLHGFAQRKETQDKLGQPKSPTNRRASAKMQTNEDWGAFPTKFGEVVLCFLKPSQKNIRIHEE